MEPTSQESLLTPQSKQSGLADIKKFAHAFYDYLHSTELLHIATCKYDDQNTNITPVAEPGSTLQSPYDAILKMFEESSPCLHEPIRELCLYIFPMLTKGLKEDQLNLTEDETHDLADALEALMFIAVYVKTATKLYTCKNHQDKIMGNLDWPAPLIRKLIPYLVQHMDSTTRIDIVLLRTLEIIVNPPQAFGSSKLWLTIMREIEEDFILEDSQQSKFLSLLFVMLNTEARVRLCGIYQEQLQQLLDADTLPTLSLETLTLIYYMSSNSKTQQALIKNGVHTILIDWMTECFMSRKDLSQKNGREKVDIVSKIFINLAQGLGKTALDEVISFIQNRAVAFYKLYEKNDIFDEIMGPIVSNFPFSSLVPVTFNIGSHPVGNSDLKFNNVDAPLFEDHKISVLNAKQSQELKNLIQREHFKLEPFKKFDIEWTQVPIVGKDWTEKIQSAESVLMTFLYVFRGKIIKIGVCIGDGFTWKNGWIVSNTSKKNFLFTCLENGEINRFNTDVEIRFSQAGNPCEFEIKDLKAQEALLYSNSGWKISVSKAFVFRVAKENALDKDCQFSRDYASLWCGDAFIDLHKSQNSDCLYGSNPIAASLRNSFQLLRPNNHIFFVPKDVTLKEFLQLAFPKAENLLDTLMVYHEQHIITLDTKLVDLKPSTENQSLFQIQDLRIVCLDNSEQLNEEIAPPVKTCKNIISRYYSKVGTPVLSHLLTEGEPLDILKKIAPGGGLSQDFQNAYKIILDKIVPHVPTLGSIMAKDLILVLYQILFVRFEEIDLATRILQKTILKYSPNAQFKACNPKGLYKLLNTAIGDALKRDSDHERLTRKYHALLRELRDADLIQDNNLVGLLLSTLNKGETELQLKTELIQMNMFKPKQHYSQIEQLFTDGFDIIIPYCSDQVCNKNFTKLAQSVTTFMNIKGYPLALTQNGIFLENLSDLIMQFRKQNQGQNIEVFEVYVDPTIEEMLLKLIHFVFATLLQVLQANQDFSSWLNILDVLVRTLNIFNLLQDELKKIYDRKNIVPSQVEKLVETVESVTTVLKILAHEQALMTQGLDIVRTFSLQYLAKMESARTAQTLVQVLSLLDSINDDGLFFQTLASILELLEAWSKNKVLVNVFDTKVRDPKNEESMKTVPFSEYCMTFSNSKKLEGANQIAQLVVAKSNEIDKEELKANKKAVIVRVFALFKSIQENLNNREL